MVNINGEEINLPEKHQCEEMIVPKEQYGSFHQYQCTRTATVERDGKNYCKQHDPEYIKAKNEEREKAWRKEMDSRKEKDRRRKAEEQYCKNLTTEYLEEHAGEISNE